MPANRIHQFKLNTGSRDELYEGLLPKTLHDQMDSQHKSQDALRRIRYERMMLRNLRLFPKSTFDERRKETGLKISNSTASYYLHYVYLIIG
jgi:hypothetical protein